MNPVITALLVLLPLALIMGCAAYLAKRSAAGMPVKRTLAINLSCFLVVMLSLIHIWPEHRQLVEAYRREFLNSGDSIDGSAGLAWCSGFDEWMALLADNSRDKTARPGCVATSVFLAFDGPQLVGMVEDVYKRQGRSCGAAGSPYLFWRRRAAFSPPAPPWCLSLIPI